MKKVTFGIAALSLSVAGVALAQVPATNPAVTPGSTKVAASQFGTMDTNRDGKVSRDEAKTHAELTSSFTGLDTDSDTYLSEKEFGMWKSSSGVKDPGKTDMSDRSGSDRSNPGSTDRGTTPMPVPATRQ